MTFVANALALIANTLISLYLYAILLRFWMQWVRAGFSNPIGQFVISVTNPVVLPLRRIIPPIGNIDTATILFAFLVAVIKVLVLLSLMTTYQPNIVITLIYGVGETIRASIHIFIAAIFIHVIASWIATGSYNPIVSIAYQISEPILAPARKLIPPIGGLDLSALLVLLFLNVFLELLVRPISPFI